jgi:hypothetical protein
MKKTTKYALASLLTVGTMALVVTPALASSVVSGIPTLSSFSGVFGSGTLNDVIKGFISIFLALLGVIAVLMILWGGFIWMTAAGDPDKVKKAKDIIYSGIVGLIIILVSYAIATFVMSAIQGITGGDINNTL